MAAHTHPRKATAMIFHWSTWETGALIVCGSFWPGAYDGAPPPAGYPDQWRPDQIASTVTAQPNPHVIWIGDGPKEQP